VLPAIEIKNNVDLTFELTGESADLIRWYVDTQRSAEPECRFLFPGDQGRHKSESALRQQIMGTIRKYVGIVVNPHLFRHFLAYMHLRAHPGEYEIVRLCLGHKRMETTLAFYAGFETEAAVRHYDQQITRLRRPGEPK
jgi:site-specific recombinase XerC